MRFLAAIAIVLMSSTLAVAETVTLRWDLHPDPEVTKYKLYWGPASRSYNLAIDVVGRGSTETTVDLAPGRYFFGLTAINEDDRESGFSNEVETTVGGGGGPGGKCDINGDGLVDVIDLQVIINAALGGSCGNCDLNGDGAADILDIQNLINVILGVTSCQP